MRTTFKKFVSSKTFFKLHNKGYTKCGLGRCFKFFKRKASYHIFCSPAHYKEWAYIWGYGHFRGHYTYKKERRKKR